MTKDLAGMGAETRHMVGPLPAPDSLSARLAGQLRTMIATDALKPGDRLRERSLAMQLDASRTPLREALKLLAGDGLVTLLPNRGAIVTALSAEEIAQKIDVLCVLEGFAGSAACRTASDTQIAEIRALHHEMFAAFERRDRPAYFRLNQAVHAQIVAATGNQTLIQFHDQLNRQLYRYRYQGSADPDLWATAIQEHTQIVSLLTARDAEALEAYLRMHVRSTWTALTERAASSSPDEVKAPRRRPAGRRRNPAVVADDFRD